MNLRELIQPDDGWLDAPTLRQVVWVAATAFIGLALYGFTMGYWRDPLLGGYVAVKLPLLVALTLLCNGLLNGLLGMLLGTGLGFRQSLLALLTAFAIMGLILGSLAPVTLLLALNAPPPDSPSAKTAHATYLVMHTLLIGFAGIASNTHLHRLLAKKSPTPTAATVTLLAWLGGNAFLGAQFSWILRPFFGSPKLIVEFLRKDPMRDNFYQAVWRALHNSVGDLAIPVLCIILLLLAIPIVRAIQSNHQTTPKP
ncbi:MAG: hypothetical protein H8M99_02950 [Gloeobacteraceae cyanobacterium ES-bin-144]|nr:hypothetical protein [Verrucomicrobiales bacterium]